MEIKVNRAIREYQEAIFFGLSFRRLIFAILALLSAIGIYFCFRNVFGISVLGWLCILGAAPFAAAGFFRYHGMNLEQFLWAWIRLELLTPRKLVFRSKDLYAVMLEKGEKRNFLSLLYQKGVDFYTNLTKNFKT